ncbi:MAG TPA: endo-1,4-beta-xylanase [Thermoleophilaceae bacterium]|nr:endo-1,4-beta-xylanase [Thermoleophilaceae bacterium]
MAGSTWRASSGAVAFALTLVAAGPPAAGAASLDAQACAGQAAARHGHIAAVLDRRAGARKDRGQRGRARADRRRSLWHARLARYYGDQALLRPVPRGAAVTYRTLRRSRALRRSFLTGFEQLTPENEMKMERLQPAPGIFRFAEADRMVRFARRYCKRIRGHTLVYGRQLPRWATDGRYGPHQLGFEMEWHVRTVMSRYAGRVAEWDVVNEAIGPDGRYARNVWFEALGRQYVERAFRAAHDADPSARLFYNDSGIELPDHPHTVAVRAMVKRLRRRGVPIHGVGIQNHVSTTHHASEAQLASTIRGFTRMGLKVAITEMDVQLDPPGTRARRLERQRLVFRAAARACARNPGCSSFSTWGVGDRVSWLGPAAGGLLFDRGYRPKPAYHAVSRSLGSPTAP